MRLLAERLVDGIVVIPATGSGALLARGSIPLVLVDRLAPGVEADAVLADNEGGAYEATMALAAEGRSRIGFIGGSLEVSTARERYEGYLRAMREAGLRPEGGYTTFLGLSVASGYEAMRSMRSKPGGPDAYFLVNGYVHLGATNYLVAEEGEDDRSGLAFAAFDEMPYAPLMRFCRYSVSQPVAEMGIRAARILLSRIAGDCPASPEEARLPTTLIRHGNQSSSK